MAETNFAFLFLVAGEPGESYPLKKLVSSMLDYSDISTWVYGIADKFL